jgi:hypothetical protein
MGDWRCSSTVLNLSRVSKFTLYPGERAPGTHWIGGWVGPRTGLDAVKKRKISHCLESNQGRCSLSLYRLSYPDSFVHNRLKCNIYFLCHIHFVLLRNVSAVHGHHQECVSNDTIVSLYAPVCYASMLDVNFLC